MEAPNNFFIDDLFFETVEEMMDYYDVPNKESEIPIDFSFVVYGEHTTESKMFTLNTNKLEFFAENFTESLQDEFIDRQSTDPEDDYQRLKHAFKQSFDLEKYNDMIPSLHYCNGNLFQITLEDLRNWGFIDK